MYSVFIPILMGIIQLKRTNSYLILLLLLVFFSCLADFITFSNYALRPTIHAAYSIVQYFLIFLIFVSQTKTNALKRTFLILFLLLISYTLLYHLYLEEATITLPNIQTVTTFTVIALCLLFLSEIYTDVSYPNLFHYPLFWITMALLIYFAGNLFLFIAKNIFTMEKMYLLYYPIHNVLNATKNILFGVAFFTQFYYPKRVQLHE